MENGKPINAKPSFYAQNFQPLKEIAFGFGYNLVIHGSLNRDMDLVAIPWQKDVLPHSDMIQEFAEYLGGQIMLIAQANDKGEVFGNPVNYTTTHHGRMQYVIDLYRGGYEGEKFIQDPQYYIDISVMSTL